MALPKEPRQKMINIMYLVLTALLALNVSAEIINAFRTINQSLEKTNNNVGQSTTDILKTLGKKLEDPTSRDRAMIWKPKADSVAYFANQAYDFIAGLKDTLIKASSTGGKLKEDDQNATTRILVKEGKGKELLEVLKRYKENVLNTDPLIRKQFEETFQVNLDPPKSENSAKRSWEEAYFYMSPTIGALSILSKFQNDIRTSENQAVTFCLKKVGEVEIVFDSYASIVGQNSSYLMPGQNVEIRAGIGAFSKDAKPTISINGAIVPIGPEGYALTSLPGGGVGPHEVPVKITYTNQNTGKEETITEVVKYTVGQSSAAVSLDRSNIMWVGIPNPITVAASGGGADKVNLSVSGAGASAVKTGPGRYNVILTTPGKCQVTVQVDGNSSTFEYRVYNLPPPTANIGTFKSGGAVPASALAGARLDAMLDGVGDLSLGYTVKNFSVKFMTKDGQQMLANISGNEVKTNKGIKDALLNSTVPGTIVTFFNINATMNANSAEQRSCAPIIFFTQ